MESWHSPDNKIKKIVIKEGIFGNKPTECCQCNINISEANVNLDHINNIRCIGDTDSEFTRLLDITLQMMNIKETARVTFSTNKIIEFTLQLIDYKSNGFIFEWTAAEKYDLATKYKTRGNNFIKNNEVINASHQFSRGLKILLSIPFNVEEKPTFIDNISIVEINVLKSIIYSNLAYCYLKVNNFDRVINLCKKALNFNSANIKALYRMAMACYELHYYDEAESTLVNALRLEPNNIAILNLLKSCRFKLHCENAKFNDIVRKMFQ